MPERSCWPTPAQQDLLLAALAEPARALPAWQRCREHARSTREVGELRLLPLIDVNLRRAGVAEEDLAYARAQRRKATVANEILFRGLAPVVAALRERGIETILLKGVALSLRHYEQPGVRPMGDVDVLVSPRNAEQAVATLLELGFAPKTPLSARRIELIHAEDFADARGRHIDLHWRLYPQRREEIGGNGTGDELWSRSRPVELCGVPARVMSAADELLHVIVHGLHWSPQATLRWASDAAAIAKSTSEAVEWEVFVAEAQRLRFVAPARDGLDYLADVVGIAVPVAVRETLAALPVAGADRLEYRLGCRRSTYTVLGGLPIFAFQYAADARARGRRATPTGFLAYMAEYWGYDSVSAVLRRMGKRAVLRAWSVLSGRALPPPDPV
ncbi:MAG TPA: nucleotidyltransferase family protein [Candidatus Limnocylindrales bacterium]|nr:nucleotidyltransferase family protein [Candidatus Limnocylindrales bacterium]